MSGHTFPIILIMMLAFFLAADACGSSGGSSRSSGWGFGNGGITYTFRNGVRVTGTGGISPPRVGVGVTIPFGRKKRNVEDQVKSSKGQKKCDECLAIEEAGKYGASLPKIAETKNAGLVMVVSFHADDFEQKKEHALMKFTVVEVYKTPESSIVAGGSFEIDAYMSLCPCLKHLDAGLYIFTGHINSFGKLEISGEIIKALAE